MPQNEIMTSRQKALRINLDKNIYGSLAEIGAGQEVARHFFRAGGAAGTMAKTMSAYDMVVSDAIYGKEQSGRYVCEGRLSTMLEREYDLVLSRLKKERSPETRFFAFANTVAAKSFSGSGDCHGWLGNRFQHRPGAEFSEVVIHIRMLDRENVQQQEAVGVIGINLIYSCYYDLNSQEEFVTSLMNNLSSLRIEIDMIRVSGPAFSQMNSRLLSLELVKQKLCKMIIFDSQGEVQQASDMLYKKNAVVLRGSWRPPTLVNLDMLESGVKKFKKTLTKTERDSLTILPEITMNKLIERGEISNEDFLARVDLVAALGHNVLISNCETFSGLSKSLSKMTNKKIVFVLGAHNLEEILKIDNYESSHDSFLEGLGGFFGRNCNAYVYPAHNEAGELVKVAESIDLDERLMFLYLFLLENNYIQNITTYRSEVSHIWSRTVLKMIQNGDSKWEKMVPPKVAAIVRKYNLFR